MKTCFVSFKDIKMYAIFFSIVCRWSIVQAILPQLTSQELQQQQEAAIEVTKKFQQGMLSKEEANELLFSILSDYSEQDGKIPTLIQFVRGVTKLENPVMYAASEQRGWSGSEVYVIQNDENKGSKYFLKIFPYDSKHYLPEIFGLTYMNEVDDVGSPKICALGQCSMNDSRYFLVLETPVLGTSIQQYFRQVGEYPIDSKERVNALGELCEAVQACGVGLAKLHTHVPTRMQSLPQEDEQIIRLDLENAIEELLDQPKGEIEIEKLQAYTDYILQKMKAEDHLTGLVYDDIKTIHTFYDLVSQKFSLVNPHHLHLSFNQKGETKGLLIRDICKYLISLTLNRFEYYIDADQHVCRKELLTENEIDVVKDRFKMGYEWGGGVLPSTIEEEFVLLQHNLFFIKNSRRELPEPEWTRVQDLIKISIKSIESHIS